MKSNESIQPPKQSEYKLIEQFRLSISKMLKEYLQVYKKFDQLKKDVDVKATGQRSRIYQADFPYNDADGKVNWDIIHRFIRIDIEKYLNEELGMLNPNEIRLCCLLFLKMDCKTISKILAYSPNSIYQTIRRIRLKTGINDLEDVFRLIAFRYLTE
jgi:DNA-binding CsgD family transcriptional regulator